MPRGAHCSRQTPSASLRWLTVGAVCALAVTAEGRGRADDGPSIELTLEGEVAPAEARRHSLSLTAGEYLRLRVERLDTDVQVTLLDPQGRVARDADTLTFPPGPTALEFVAELDGEHALELRSAPGSRAGRYSLRVLERRPAGEAERRRTAAGGAYRDGERARLVGTADSLASAGQAYERALGLYRALGDAAGEANALTGLARVRDALGEKPAAQALYAQALALQRAQGLELASAYTLNFVALVHDQLGERERALSVLAEARQAAEACGDRRVQGITLGNQGLVQLNLGRLPEALALYERALQLDRQVGNVRAEATALTSLGVIRNSLGDTAAALAHLFEALPLRRAVGEPRDLAATLNDIGTVHFARDELPEALARYREAREAMRAAGDRSGEGATLHNLAHAHSVVGEYQQAIGLYEQALPLFESVSAKAQAAHTLTNMAALYGRLGDRRRAALLFEQALPVHRSSGNRTLEAATLANLGTERRMQGELREALSLHEQALALRRALRDRGAEAGSRRELGRVRAAQGRHDLALESYAESIRLYRTLPSPRGEASTLVHQAASLESLGRPEQARAAAETGLRLHREVGDPRGEAAALYALAHVQAGAAELEAARASLEQALDLIESLRARLASQDLRASFRAGVQDYYELLIDVLMRLHTAQPGRGFDALALEAGERARARGLLEILAEARSGIREGVEPALLERERRLQQSLNAKAARLARLSPAREGGPAAVLRREIEGLAAEQRSLQAELRARSPRYASLLAPQPLGLAELRAVLDADTVLLEYALGQERSYVWALSRDALECHELPPRDRLEALAQRLRAELEAEGGALPASSFELGRALIGPVSEAVAGRRVVMAPDGALQTIPLALLADPATGRPLVHDHEVLTVASASVLAEARRDASTRPAAAGGVAVLADPVFDAQDPRVRAGRRAAVAVSRSESESASAPTFARLLGSRQEAAAIVALARPGSALRALDFRASRATALGGALSRYRVVHFATHAVLDHARPELSGIVLSLVDPRGRPQDGFLRLHEVYNLRLPVDLVVLSACRTGLGQEVRGEGLVGLTRGFMYAGARQVLTTLWKVDDRATAELMRRFYAELLGPRGRSPAAALRSAQLALAGQRRWRSPYYWAGFVLHGDWR